MVSDLQPEPTGSMAETKATQSDQPPPQPEAQPSQAPPSRRRILDFIRAAPARPPRKGLVFHLEVVFAVAAILATLFTAWTPGRQSSLFPPPASTNPALALQPTPTFIPGAPTPTLPNPRLVGIVAGHWKNDSGAVCPDGLKEVDLNLNIATQVQKILAKEGYQVDLLHEFDDRLTGYHAAALVSIHNDSCDFINNEATGFKVAAAFATKYPDRTARLTSCLRARYGSITGLPVHSTSVTPDMTSYHAFGEINENTPAVIIETGFMNLDRTILTQEADRVAQGVASGILCYLKDESVGMPTPENISPEVSPTAP